MLHSGTWSTNATERKSQKGKEKEIDNGTVGNC